MEWRNSTLRFASTPERRNENTNLTKHFISSSRIQTYNQSLSHTNVPRLASTLLLLIADKNEELKFTCILIKKSIRNVTFIGLHFIISVAVVL